MADDTNNNDTTRKFGGMTKQHIAMLSAIRILSEGLTDEFLTGDFQKYFDSNNEESGAQGKVKHPETDKRLKENRG